MCSEWQLVRKIGPPQNLDYCTTGGKAARGHGQVDGEQLVVHVARCFGGCGAVAGGGGVGLLLLLLLLLLQQQAAQW